MTMIDTAREMTLTLLARRGPGRSICPSEVARCLTATPAGRPGDGGWRDAMPAVHDAIDRLVAEGVIRLSWKGSDLAARAGPYRIRRST